MGVSSLLILLVFNSYQNVKNLSAIPAPALYPARFYERNTSHLRSHYPEATMPFDALLAAETTKSGRKLCKKPLPVTRNFGTMKMKKCRLLVRVPPRGAIL